MSRFGTNHSAARGAVVSTLATMSLVATTIIGSPVRAAPVEATSVADSPAGSVQWQPCPTDTLPTLQCGTVRVPRDYQRPARGHFDIALARIPATGTAAERIGSLVWDAGGPGGASTQMMDLLDRQSAAIKRQFDLVGFDPRGIGSSEPALRDCAQPWPVRPARQPNPDWLRVQRLSSRELAEANRDCLRRANRFAGFMGTVNVVRDLDRIRRALGDRRLTFWATSYGTRIGYVYALRHPNRVRAMVLDGNIDPTGDYVGLAEIGGTSQNSAFAFLRRQDPRLGRLVVRTTSELTDTPITLGPNQRFSRWDWLDVVGDIVAFPDGWSQLRDLNKLLDQADTTGPDGRAARERLVGIKARPNSNEGAGFSIVNCLDYADRPTPRRQAAIAATNAAGGPFGGSLSLQYAMGCAGLGRLDPDPIPTLDSARLRAKVAGVPVVVANATHDGSTPMPWARSMRRAFGMPPLISYRSSQHVIWGASGSACVDRPIDRFVISETLPSSRTCPFIPPR